MSMSKVGVAGKFDVSPRLQAVNFGRKHVAEHEDFVEGNLDRSLIGTGFVCLVAVVVDLSVGVSVRESKVGVGISTAGTSTLDTSACVVLMLRVLKGMQIMLSVLEMVLD